MTPAIALSPAQTGSFVGLVPVTQTGVKIAANITASQIAPMPRPNMVHGALSITAAWQDRETSDLPFIVEEAHEVFRDLSKARVKRLRTNLHEHVAHVLDQDKLSLITHGFEVSIELNRLRLQNLRVVDTLNKKDGRRSRSNEICGAGKNQIPLIILAEDLLNAGGREP